MRPADPSADIEDVASAAIRTGGEGGSVSLRWEGVRPNFAIAPRSVELRNWQCFEGAVLSLVFSAKERHSMLGSAAMVAPGIAVSTTHTFEEYLPGMRRGEIALTALGIRSDGAQMWNAKFVVCVERTDICLLILEYRSELPRNGAFRQFTITTRMPAIGEPVVIAGFQASRDEFQQAVPSTLELEGRLRLTSGSVRESYPQGRDPGLVPWPSLEVDAPLFGGMSGGPVFDAKGGLIGLGSRSFNMGPTEEPSPMVVALLWPALGTPFPLADGSGKTTTLLELDQRFMQIERPGAVHVETLENPPGRLNTYTPWT